MKFKMFLVALLSAVGLFAANLDSAKSYEDIKKSIKSSNKYSVVELGVGWCPYCRSTKEELIKLPKEYEKNTNFFYVDLEVYEDAAKDYNVNAFPVMLYFNQKGELIEKKVGGIRTDALIKKLKEIGATK